MYAKHLCCFKYRVRLRFDPCMLFPAALVLQEKDDQYGK